MKIYALYMYSFIKRLSYRVLLIAGYIGNTRFLSTQNETVLNTFISHKNIIKSNIFALNTNKICIPSIAEIEMIFSKPLPFPEGL